MPLVESLLVVAGKGFLDAVSPSIRKKFDAFLQKTDWYTASGRYYDKIEKTYGWTRILGKPEPVKLESIYTDVYLLDKITALQRYDISQMKQERDVNYYWRGARLSALELIKEGTLNRLYILGKPGAGKTTFLKYVALKASQDEIKKIPIFVSLKEWVDSGDKLMDFLVRQFDICDFPESQLLIEYILETGQAVVLFDGLDETQQESGKRDKTIDDIRNFSRKYDLSQILITCRIAATDYTFEEFHYLEMADFTSGQVRRYVENWFGTKTEKQEQFEKEFTLPENYGLREMANTPLLLSLICLNFDETGTFPSRRVEIYEEGINALLHKWDSTRSIRRDEIYKGLSLGRKRQMFARVAAQTFENNEYFIPKRKLSNMIVDYLCQLPNGISKEDVDGDAVLKSIEAQHSIFIERAQNIYSFSHLTFQEFFTAKYIVDNVASGALERLLTKKNIIDNRWREVIFNTASLLDDADSFFEVFKQVVTQIAKEHHSLAKFLNWAETKAIKAGSAERSKIQAIVILYIEFEYKQYEIQKSYPEFSIIYKLKDKLRRHFLWTTIPSNSDYEAENIDAEYVDVDSIDEIILVLSKEFSPVMEDNIALDLAFFLSYFLVLILGRKDLDYKVERVEQDFIGIWHKLKKNISENENKEFVKDVENLLLPVESMKSNFTGTLLPSIEMAMASEWRLFTERLRHIMQTHLNICLEWDFASSETTALQQYLSANKFLIDCLKLAVVSNRWEIKKSLLLIPS